jgi:Uma2 family endonuclease
MAVAATRVTLDEFLKLPEEEPALEYADGVITQKVSPKGVHSRLQAVLIQLLNQAGQPDKLALAFPELRATFAGASRVPDISVYRRDRIPTDAGGRIANEFTTPPDIAIEIVSPEQSVNALVRRCVWYVANGVAIALLVDPVDESVLVFRPAAVPVARSGAEQIDLGDILPSFALSVEELFGSLQI